MASDEAFNRDVVQLVSLLSWVSHFESLGEAREECSQAYQKGLTETPDLNPHDEISRLKKLRQEADTCNMAMDAPLTAWKVVLTVHVQKMIRLLQPDVLYNWVPEQNLEAFLQLLWDLGSIPGTDGRLWPGLGSVENKSTPKGDFSVYSYLKSTRKRPIRDPELVRLYSSLFGAATTALDAAKRDYKHYKHQQKGH